MVSRNKASLKELIKNFENQIKIQGLLNNDDRTQNFIKEADSIVEKAKSDSEAEKERVSTELKSEVADLSLEISQKVASSMTKKDQQKLIDKFIKDMG